MKKILFSFLVLSLMIVGFGFASATPTDTEGPTITNVHVEPVWPSCTQDSYIYATITDESGIDPVLPNIFLHWKYDGYAWAVKQFTLQPIGDVYRVRVPTDAPTNAVNFKYYIEAEDIYGNPTVTGDSENYLNFTYDCANPVASVYGMPTSWVSSAAANANCTDDASGCNSASYLLYSSPTSIGTCPTSISSYTLTNPSTITAHSWVCSYVEDNVGNFDVSDPEEFMVDGVNPTANTGGPYECNEGDTITLDGSGSYDDSGFGVSYAWDLDNDGQFDNSTNSNPEYYCADGNNSATVSLKVTDHVGNTNTEDSIVTIHNVNPWNVNAGGSYSGSEGTNVSLSGSADDVPADTLSYAWDLDNDGTYETPGQNVDFACVDDLANYPISMKVSDDDGGVSYDSATVTCSNVNPVVEAGADQTIDEGQTVTIAPTFTDVGVLDTHTATVNWGDGSSDESIDPATSSMSLSHTYCAVGNHTVTITVTDNDGGVASDTLIVTVENVAPTIVSNGGPYVGVVGETITFNAEATDVCGNQDLTYSWDFEPNGTHVSNWAAYWNSRFNGTVVLTVSDGTDSVSENVPVTIYDYKIDLDKGWNLISIPLVPENDNTSINSVFGQIIDSAERVWSYTYDASEGKNVWKYNELLSDGSRWSESSGRVNDIVPGYGYYVLMNEGATIYANGEKFYGVGDGSDDVNVPMPPTVTLNANSWNLIGTYGVNEIPKRKALVSLTTPYFGKYFDIVYDENGISQDLFEPTEGYWLSVKLIGTADTIEYKANYKDYDNFY